MTQSPTAAGNSTTPFPTRRPPGRPLDPPVELSEQGEKCPVSRWTFPDGHRGWLATGHAEVRAVLADRRFSSRFELMHNPVADLGPLSPAPVGDPTGLDAPEHTRYRSMLAGKFTVRRMRQLTARVEQITASCLDAMTETGGPVDLVEIFAYPIPAQTICELLGVPFAERDAFQSHASAVNSAGSSQSDQMAAFTAIAQYIRDLVAVKRSAPTDDLLSDLTTADLDDEELTGIGTFLLGAGLDTTANMLALGVFALLTHPAQFAALRDDPDLADRAVEELMRYLSIVHTNSRVALTDVELAGHTIAAGETVALSLQTANRDPRRFDTPNVLDIRRNATGHLGFGYGPHQCLGQQLARVEMRVALPALVSRFPALRLAVPPDDVPLRHGDDVYGARRLPVTW
ncbi:cytochrome P450 [Nocardia callitridis]|uniref:Cytochrome P450 n=1 Tax=Nocardia callitridis TaxID=648753 RepID=A0ABP9KDS3_9NOCA